MDNQETPNVLILIGNFRNNSGGAQRAIANQLQHSDGQQCRYTVCHLFGEGSLADELPHHADVVGLEAGHAFDIRIFGRLRKLYQQRKISIVHTQSHIAGFWGRVTAMGNKQIRVISTSQNTHQRYKNLTGVLNGITLPLADRITCVSDSTRDSFFAWEKWLLSQRQIATIHNAVDTQHYARLHRDGAPELREQMGAKPGDVILGNIARMDTQKNQHHMIREFASIAKANPNAKLFVIGRGHLGDSLQSLIDQLDVGDQVKLCGPRSDMDNVYRMIDIFLLPSLYEGFSVALLEGMASGLPVVCSNIPQITEATADCAIAVDPVQEGVLAEAMQTMIRDDAIRQKYSAAAKQRAAELFDARAMTERYESMYRECA